MSTSAQHWRIAAALALALAAVAPVLAGCGGSRASHVPSTFASTGASVIVPAPSAPPVPGTLTPAAKRAATALGAFDQAFYVAKGRQAHHADSTAGRRADFWRQAELIEMEEDAYQAGGAASSKAKIVALLRGVVSLDGRLWTRHTWNDDITWMVIACARAYELTGDTSYLAMAKRNFDATYARAWSTDLGGGLWWTTARTQKNVTTSAPAAIAAAKLAVDLHDPSYLTKAEGLYSWLKKTLRDRATGQVWDSVSPGANGAAASVNRVALTYNQGTFIGAADLLYQATRDRTYYRDALQTLRFTKAHMTTNGILPAEINGSNGNFGGFKGIFCRWAVKFVSDNRIRAFDPWFRLNADTAWSHRNAQSLIGADWSAPTGGGVLRSWDCSSAVVLLEVLAGR